MNENLGKKAKDLITGFTGTITGFCKYISGCNQVLIAPEVGKDGSFKESNWFDLQRVEILSEKKIELNNKKTPGPDRAAPKR